VLSLKESLIELINVSFTTKHKRFSLTTLQQSFCRKLAIYFIRTVASVCNCHANNHPDFKILPDSANAEI